MNKLRVALLQINGTDDPSENLDILAQMTRDAVGEGAEFVLSPEVSNCISKSRTHQRATLCEEADDPVLKGAIEIAREHGVRLLLGSLALRTGEEDWFANRSFLLNPRGEIEARYDKIHMFDVRLSETESYHESSAYAPGETAVVTDLGPTKLGLTICYDLRFPSLYRKLAQAGAGLITVPSAFSKPTGKAHWEALLRTRAIETGSFVLAPAQTGTHKARRGKPRETYGHSMIIGPWGDILGDAGEAPGVLVADLDLDQINDARQRVPSLHADRAFTVQEW